MKKKSFVPQHDTNPVVESDGILFFKFLFDSHERAGSADDDHVQLAQLFCNLIEFGVNTVGAAHDWLVLWR